MKDLIVLPDITLKQALKKLSQVGEKCLVVADDKNTLLGTLSDGDLRKAILNNFRINDSISGIYQLKPILLVEGSYNLDEVKNIFLNKKFDLIPIVNQNGIVTDILVWDKIFKNGEEKQRQKLDVPVVIMAGGKGTRLEPFTNVLPKPLIPIHEKPIIEHITELFTDVGVCQFILTVNYKARILKAYFEELNPDYKIDFIEEDNPLGTAGSLRLLEYKFSTPFFVTNCDTIIKIDYHDLYEFHQKNNYDITLVASSKNYTIPYGTCELNGEGHLKRINEKPEYDFLVNTGLYVVNPDIVHLIPKDKLYHITHLIEDIKNKGKKIGVYPIDDDAWIDVGQWAEYQKAVERL
jgi:dTDP-glucose pyrophosphorylase